MKCPKCGNELYIDFRNDGYVLWRCHYCPHMEVTEDGTDASPYNNWKTHKEVKGDN